MYISRTSEKRDARVKRIRPTPPANIVPIRIDTGRKSHVTWSGNPVTARMSTERDQGQQEVDEGDADRGRHEDRPRNEVRLAISLASWVWSAVEEVLWAKKFQKRSPDMKYTG